MHAEGKEWTQSGSSSAVDSCCFSASAVRPMLQPVAYMLAWWTVSEWCGWSCRGAAVSASRQWGTVGAAGSFVGRLLVALQLGRSLTCDQSRLRLHFALQI
jgi:hypothetical protein